MRPPGTSGTNESQAANAYQLATCNETIQRDTWAAPHSGFFCFFWSHCSSLHGFVFSVVASTMLVRMQDIRFASVIAAVILESAVYGMS